jgi:hypothetical protein
MSRRPAALALLAGLALAATTTLPAGAEDSPLTRLNRFMQQLPGKLDKAGRKFAKPAAAPAKDDAAPPAEEEPANLPAVDTADAVPLPRPRPPHPATMAAKEEAATPISAPAEPPPLEAQAFAPTAPRAASLVPFPEPRPARPADDAIAPLAMLPPDAAPAPAAPLRRLGGASCAALAGLGVEAKVLAPISEGKCGVAAPAAISALDNGAVQMPGEALVNCDVAASLARWMDETVQPAAKAAYGMRVTAIRVADSYSCRSRNRVAGAKLSEHAFGNAIDLGAFRIGGGRWVEVGGAHNDTDQRFLKTIRAEACGPFTTVLGPGSDPYHSEHLHLDIAKRRTAGPSRGYYCR